VIARADITLAGPVTCPKCGNAFQGSWTADREADLAQRCAGAQQCAMCHHLFVAHWPGFKFDLETVIDQPGSGGDCRVPGA
jgi:hypothetical protein